MFKDIYEYFENLEQINLPRKKQNLIYDNDIISYTTVKHCDGSQSKPLIINGIHYYDKPHNYEQSIIDIASTNMYNHIGIPTPPVYIMENPNTHSKLHTITQDVHSIKELSFVRADELLSKSDIMKLRLHHAGKWDPLYDGDIQRIFLKYMTKECFDQLIGLFLVDELRSEKDRHEKNYFFYKEPIADKYTGVLPIDNEYAAVLFHTTRNKCDFDEFLYTPYHSPTILGSFEVDNKPYISRIRDIKELLQDSILTQDQINLMKRVLSYDLPSEIKTVGNRLYPTRSILNLFIGRNITTAGCTKTAYDSMAKLWDYNYKELGKDLEL